ncbi:hypothetical protein BKA62DRAFT_134384 [Auriculariales sp. MPI-PUGE-AT-0066]|nr:hypothetical protein BKA62DRAFT_134384 [Auriculariales sp. MPI-PUGE-AT-0066]
MPSAPAFADVSLSVRRAAAVRILLLVLLFLFNSLWLAFVATAFVTSRTTDGSVGLGQSLLLASVVIAVLLVPNIIVLDYSHRHDSSTCRFHHARNFCVAILVLLQYGAAAAFTFNNSEECSKSPDRFLILDRCNVPMHIGSWGLPSLALVLLCYLAWCTWRRSAPQSDAEQAVPPLARNGTDSSFAPVKSLNGRVGTKESELRAPAPAYAYAAAGAMRRLSQTFFKPSVSPTARW